MTQVSADAAHDRSLGDLDHYLAAEGRHYQLHQRLGSHPIKEGGVDGVRFAVWAPNARRVSVVGDFNGWNGQSHALAPSSSGIWQTFVPGLAPGVLYKYEIETAGGVLPLKADPVSRAQELPPRTASCVPAADPFCWSDSAWLERRAHANPRAMPMAIYEVHLGSWMRRDDGGFLSYTELADKLVPYVKQMGFTHIEVLPLGEHPFYGSWGYQPLSLFAPTARYGDAAGLKTLIDRAHGEGIGVILDWVVSHFPEDAHGLAHFDGTALYEHDDPRQSRHLQWNTLVYNYGRTEVANLLICNALYWLEEFHFDGLRADAVASILYLDYAKSDGQWIPNAQGGHQNLEAVAFLRRMNEAVYAHCPGAFTIAEESTSWPRVSQPVYAGGLGFGFKWNMGWMNDTLRYMARDPVHRRHHHNELTFGLLYAFNENFILPLSHDEVVHGKGSLLGKMPGDEWQKFANLRAYLSFFYTHPGKKLLFMGCEFGQRREWNHDAALDWDLLGQPLHAGMQSLVRDLNHLYRTLVPLHEHDCDGAGFRWINADDQDHSIVSYIRFAADRRDFVVIVCNFTPVVRRATRIGVPAPGAYREIFNSDSHHYGGSNVGNSGAVTAAGAPDHGQPASLVLTLPPLAAIILQPG